MNLKKKLAAFAAAGIVMISAMPFVFAATPEPADNAPEAQQTQQIDNSQAAPAAATGNTAELTNSKYLTKGGAAFWFIFTILLNTFVSFWVGNRFYRLAKKDNHVSAEIRALRKDIEEKFVKSVGGFTEQEVDINNLNESLADDDSIKLPDKQPVLREVSAEEEERFRRWEENRRKSNAERSKPRSVVKEELREDLDDVKRIKRKNYQPKRDIKTDTDGGEQTEDLGETKQINLRGSNAVKSKAKEILGDMFPFKED